MNTLQRAFEKEYKKHLNPEKIGAIVIAKRCRDLRIDLNEAQLASVERQLREPGEGRVSIDISDEQWHGAGFPPEAEAERALNVALQDLVPEMERLASKMEQSIPRLLTETTEQLALSTLKTLKRSARRMLGDRREFHAAFEANLYLVWGRALDALETHIAIALEAGETFNREFRPAAARSSDFVFEVLTRSHARSCQIASEVVSLLVAGHADGAMARWRSLHEISVVCSFVSKHGNELAERYLLHQCIESCKAAAQYQEYSDRIGYVPFTSEDIACMEQDRAALIKRFGKAYATEYGWAAEVLGSKQPRFTDIEKSVGLDHLRPYYRMASHKVHANPKGAFFSLGLNGAENILLAGPSNTGLADPGHLTAISLAQVTTNLLTTKPNLDRLVMANILLKMNDEVGAKFWAADRRLDRMERRTKRSTRPRRKRR
jgi:Family of unknown function (DUF5677)